MGENDYQSGYRGGQFHHGMDSAEYHRGKSQKELEDTLGGAGRKTEVDGVSFTLFLLAPFIWMVYPVMGFTIYAVVGVVVVLCRVLHIPGHWGIILGLIPFVMSYFWGMKLEHKVSQFAVYRWMRGLLRIGLPFMSIVALVTSRNGHVNFNDISPQAIVGGFFGTVIIYLIFQRLDLIYFPSKNEMLKMTEKISKGERIMRPLGKRLLWGFCWFIPVVMVLNLIVNVGARLGIEDQVQRKEFYTQFNAIIFCVNAGIWYALCLLGILPGTSKYRYTKKQEEDIKEILSQENSA